MLYAKSEYQDLARQMRNVANLFEAEAQVITTAALKSIWAEKPPYYKEPKKPDHVELCKYFVNDGNAFHTTMVFSRRNEKMPYHVLYDWEWYKACLKGRPQGVILFRLTLDEDYEKMLYKALRKEYGNFPEDHISSAVFETATGALSKLGGQEMRAGWLEQGFKKKPK